LKAVRKAIQVGRDANPVLETRGTEAAKESSIPRSEIGEALRESESNLNAIDVSDEPNCCRVRTLGLAALCESKSAFDLAPSPSAD
jgi:hypothetical protein